MYIVNNCSNNEYIYIRDLQLGEKISPNVCHRIISAEECMNIAELSFTAIYDRESDGEVHIRISGEIISQRLKDDSLLYAMVYNKDGVLIGCSFHTVVRKRSCRGKTTFKTGLFLPADETISSIVIRPGYNPVVML